MSKNCSRCRGVHTPPFGKYCKLWLLKLCSNCETCHTTPFGSLCKAVAGIDMAKRDTPVLGHTMIGLTQTI